jgi:hypothetical protein
LTEGQLGAGRVGWLLSRLLLVSMASFIASIAVAAASDVSVGVVCNQLIERVLPLTRLRDRVDNLGDSDIGSRHRGPVGCHKSGLGR